MSLKEEFAKLGAHATAAYALGSTFVAIRLILAIIFPVLSFTANISGETASNAIVALTYVAIHAALPFPDVIDIILRIAAVAIYVYFVIRN